MIRGALTLVALVCAEIAAVGIAFAWVFIPGIERSFVYPIWIGGSMIAGPVAAIWAGHFILSNSEKGALATPPAARLRAPRARASRTAPPL